VILTLLFASGGTALHAQTPTPSPTPGTIFVSPESGYSSITVWGYGYFYDVSISWDGVDIPFYTIPAESSTFTAIITVPEQTSPGKHTIRVKDSELEGSATFTVLDMMGEQGEKGATGPVGASGSSGSGSQGPQGPQGPAGAQGSSGKAGPKGTPGPVGAMGAQGEKGVDGKDGADSNALPALIVCGLAFAVSFIWIVKKLAVG